MKNNKYKEISANLTAAITTVTQKSVTLQQ